MKTDALFFEFFKANPRNLFRLLGLEMEGEYAFESITVKTTEKRFDGFLIRKDGKGYRIFFEAQGYLDNKFYWRLLRQVATYYEQNDDDSSFRLIALFLEASHDPGPPKLLTYLEEQDPPILQRFTLGPCLKALKRETGELTVLKPLVAKNRGELDREIKHWQDQIKSLDLKEDRFRALYELFIYAIAQRFPNIMAKELRDMLTLSALEDSVAFQQIKEEGRDEGREEGRDEMLRDALESKFGELPAWAERKIASASQQQKKSWIKVFHLHNSLDELFREF